MADNATLISVSAFSGLAGALLTQTLSGLFTYFGDKRKYRNEAGSQYRAKKAEIAENFYFVTGETMAILKKTVTLRKKWSLAQSAASLRNISRETKKLDEQLQKLNTENWKQNLVGLYFDVALSYNELIAANTRSHLLYLELLDLGEKLGQVTADQAETLYGEYNMAVYELCAQYDAIYDLLEKDMRQIKAELAGSFRV
jgi:hypothetical protein